MTCAASNGGWLTAASRVPLLLQHSSHVLQRWVVNVNYESDDADWTFKVRLNVFVRQMLYLGLFVDMHFPPCNFLFPLTTDAVVLVLSVLLRWSPLLDVCGITVESPQEWQSCWAETKTILWQSHEIEGMLFIVLLIICIPNVHVISNGDHSCISIFSLPIFFKYISFTAVFCYMTLKKSMQSRIRT